jgi:hypothetical protein
MSVARPHVSDLWRAYFEERDAAWEALRLLSKYRVVLRDVRADCPHVRLFEDGLPRDLRDVPFADQQYGVEVWKKNREMAERAVREADEELVQAARRLRESGHSPGHYGLPTFDANILRPSPARPEGSRRGGGGGVFFR